MKKFFWIAAYKKSGNTWLRAIISSLFFSKIGKFDFSLLKKINYFDSFKAYQFVKSINKNDFHNLTNINISYKYSIEAQKRANVGGDFAFFKTHSSNLLIKNNSYTNEENTRGLIYIVRDPRDVCISYSKFFGVSLDESISIMTNINSISFLYSQKVKDIPIFESRWDTHYLSWKKLKVPKLIIKFEDLVNQTEENIRKIINFFEENYNFIVNEKEKVIKNILNTTSFQNLKKNEKKFGFDETMNNNPFFRKGKQGEWRKKLNKKQITKINHEFESVMIELGYL